MSSNGKLGRTLRSCSTESGVYDLTDYINAVKIYQGATSLYQFLSTDVSDVFQQRVHGTAVEIAHSVSEPEVETKWKVDLARESFEKAGDLSALAIERGCRSLQQQPKRRLGDAKPRIEHQRLRSLHEHMHQVLFTLQLSPKRSPEMQARFIPCQIPWYTESTDSLWRTLDSLASLNYDDKRKLLFIICDGNIIGSGIKSHQLSLLESALDTGLKFVKPTDPSERVQMCTLWSIPRPMSEMVWTTFIRRLHIYTSPVEDASDATERMQCQLMWTGNPVRADGQSGLLRYRERTIITPTTPVILELEDNDLVIITPDTLCSADDVSTDREISLIGPLMDACATYQNRIAAAKDQCKGLQAVISKIVALKIVEDTGQCEGCTGVFQYPYV
ncbi:chitin synthase-domain-containing protein [Suillus occidentalis]|nr:chitin synthase-domain-containing protein [Suillus occidentalis]